MRQQVLYIQYTADIVSVFPIYRYATVVVLNYALQNIGIARTDIQVNNVLAARHHLLGRFVTKADNALQHALLLLNLILVSKLKRLLQIVYAQLPCLFLHDFLCKHAAVYEYGLQWPEELAAEYYSRHNTAAKSQWSLTAVNLRHNLAEKQQQESEQDSDEEKFQHFGLKPNQRAYDVIAQHDDGYVDKVVRDKYCSECSLRVITQYGNALVSRILLWIEVVKVLWRQAEECYLRTTGEARQ